MDFTRTGDPFHCASALVIRGDARWLSLPDASVDLIVTSPPYWSLRDYQDGNSSMVGQIGNEPTPQAYIANLIECTAEWARVLKPGGSIFVNLGDKYAGAPGGHSIPNKSLMGLPWRYALACIDDLGLILRAEVIWSKPNGMPESVTDRVCGSHEQWFHLVKQPRYFAAIDEIREPIAPGSWAKRPGKKYSQARSGQHQAVGGGGASGAYRGPNPLGKLPSSVWEIASQPLKVPDALGVGHFASFPMEFPRRIVLGWSPVGGVVLDPFGGTGTTALVASALGRRGVTVDRSADYCRIAQWRTADPGERARALGLPKPEPVPAGQDTLFHSEATA